MSRKNKRLYYEVLPNDEGERETESHEAANAEPALTAERDAYAELMAAARRVKRVRYKITPDYSTRAFGVLMFATVVIIAGGFLVMISKSDTGRIIIGSIMLLFVAVLIAIAVRAHIKTKRVHYAYFASDARGVFCMSETGSRAVVFAYGTAYGIDGERFYTLDADGFATYLDGECTGLYAILRAERGDVELCEDDGEYYYVYGASGGGHRVYIEDGSITRIVSEQPRSEDGGVPLGASGVEQSVKTEVFVKTEPAENFAWEIPEFIRRAFDDNNVELPDMSFL